MEELKFETNYSFVIHLKCLYVSSKDKFTKINLYIEKEEKKYNVLSIFLRCGEEYQTSPDIPLQPGKYILKIKNEAGIVFKNWTINYNQTSKPDNGI